MGEEEPTTGISQERLEKILENAEVPSGYDSHTSYTRWQELQFEVVKSIVIEGLHFRDVTRDIGKGRKQVLSLRYPRDTTVDWIEVKVTKKPNGDKKDNIDTGDSPLKFSEEHLSDGSLFTHLIMGDSKREYFGSVFYLRGTNKTLKRLDEFYDVQRKYETTLGAYTEALKEVITFLSKRPDDVFKKVYDNCINRIWEKTRPLLAIIGMMEEGAVSQVFDPGQLLAEGDIPPPAGWAKHSKFTAQSNRYEEFKQAYAMAEAHIKTLQ